MQSIKVENYLKIQRIGIQSYERKFIRQSTKSFELDMLMLLDECLIQNEQQVVSDISSDSEDEKNVKIGFDKLLDVSS